MQEEIINVHTAKTHLSRLLEEVAAGKEIVIGKAGKPIARLVPWMPPSAASRQGGQLKGLISEEPDWWKADRDLASDLTDSPLFPVSAAARAAETR